MSGMSVVSRRAVIQKSAVAAAMIPALRCHALATATDSPAPNADRWRGLKVGVASYTLRKLPLDAAITAIQRVGLKYVSIKDAHLSLKSTPQERRAVAQKFKDAGITPMSCGNIAMPNDVAAIRAAFEYARDTGLPTIVCSPEPNSMAILDRMVKEFDIKLAIHNHGPEDKKFPSPYDVWKAVEMPCAALRSPPERHRRDRGEEHCQGSRARRPGHQVDPERARRGEVQVPGRF